MQVSVRQIASFVVASFCLFTLAQATVCKSPPQLLNGRYSGKIGRYYRRGCVISYLCDKGFQLEGESQITCTYSKRYKTLQWSGDAPECIGVPVKCPLLPRPTNGRIKYTKKGRKKGRSAGASVWYICNVGYTLVGKKTRNCFKNLTWSSSAPICKIFSCNRPEKPVNGLVWFKSTAAGAKAVYKCNDNHRLIGASVRTCQRTQEWTPEMPKCERVRCERLVNPRNGFVVVGIKMDIGSYAKYNCYEGFYLVWSKFRKCLPTGWSGKEPKCNAVKCDALEAPTHGSVRYSKGRYFNSTATYCCNYGHTFKQGSGDKKRICQNYGVWSGKSPTCFLKEVECEELKNPKNGMVSVTGRGLLDSATYTCKKGYTLSRLQTRKCNRNGKWSAREPNCKQTVVRCPVPPKPRQGYIKAHCHSQGCSVEFFCHQGYKLYGVRNALCLQNGQWSRSCPVCIHKI